MVSVPTAPDLTQLLLSERSVLLSRWSERSQEFTLQGCAPQLLDELARALQERRPPRDISALVELAPASAHALRELTALRAVLLELAAERGMLLAASEAALLHGAIDELLLAFAASTAKHQAEEAELRERFVSVLGHDLRNPISAIKLGSSMLARDTQAPEARRRTAERIVSSANRMLRLLEDLLDFMRLRPGSATPLDLVETSLTELCRHAIDDCVLAHPGRTITLGGGELTAKVDRRRLRQALTHVLASALEHSPADSEVRVTLLQNGQPCIRVHHGGPPIPAQELDTIFDPLRRGNLAGGSERPARGLGLGLYLAEQIVRAHGGKITAHSTREAGTSFELNVPSGSND